MISIHLLYMIMLPIALMISILLVTILYFRLKFYKLRRVHNKASSTTTTIAFFHPHCSGGGGGERVLWKAIESISALNQGGMEELIMDGDKMKKKGGITSAVNKMKQSFHVVIYTSDPKVNNYQRDVFQHVQDRFSITMPKSLPITFIHIPQMKLATTQKFTLLVESIHSMKIAYNALCQFTPDVYIDTTGCAFTFLIAKLLAHCNVLAYVHYPTISTDMLNLVWERRPTYNNTSSISQNKIYTYIKLLYYIMFAIAYGLVGSLADVILVNSTWTLNHISYLWRFYNPLKRIGNDIMMTKKIHVVYPPCDITSLDNYNEKRNNTIVSIGQFRPEKDHTKQIQSYANLLSKYNEIKNSSGKGENHNLPPIEDIKLLLIGSCRNEFDYQRVEELRKLAYEKLQLSTEQVKFIINEPYPVLLHHMSTSLIGLHTMWNEHFGISIVEMMSNGLITIGHDSGGPKSDIITVNSKNKSNLEENEQQGTGYLAHTEDQYAQAMIEIYQLDDSEKEKIRQAAKYSCERFSDDIFMHEFKHYLLKVISN